ncbi:MULTISPECIES: cell division protein SepF [unclassified Actinomyces]|uniref:cell division protein SepF n=1 Tax=unclassified Actinomyces TaxID=2609248 RepID=UPI0020182046|nr:MULTISPECIES: cell division protein SepF [unclassified Actinomyces]MCL3778243.1 cell division protein SepF [Actinomyces sp. AC-20-1]MCL3789146.1 cell division protein SepF [Actinomyces sp. 187325]MCL3791501.1 cell division protein SepF [Actinomyces sp. 186855]MCL3794091.1 cell division protein SepF [Actinomyces sp. 217892]
MSALHKMTSFLGYAQPAEDEYEQGYEVAAEPYAEDAYEAEPAYASYEEEAPAPVAVPDLRRIVTVHPTTYNEARVIGEAFRDGVPVIVNLTHMGEADARRMVDFSAGLVFGLNGAIERVTPRVFLLTPATVEIDGGEQAEENGRFFNQS